MKVRVIEPRNALNGKVDGFAQPEGNILPDDKARTVRLPRGQRAQHVIQ